jgi:hypothetical protein
MRKGRTTHSYFSCFAALVLLAQLMLAGTHVHLPAAPGLAATGSASHDTGHRPTTPSRQDSALCPLCWGQAAAYALLVPPAIELRIPANITAPRLPLVLHRLSEHTAPNAFRPRAPPV